MTNCPAPGEGLLMTLTGDNAYTGGTYTVGGLQIGNGISNGSIKGRIDMGGGGADDLVFNVAAGTETFNGQIANGSSVLKTGNGLLELMGDTTWGTPVSTTTASPVSRAGRCKSMMARPCRPTRR